MHGLSQIFSGISNTKSQWYLSALLGEWGQDAQLFHSAPVVLLTRAEADAVAIGW